MACKGSGSIALPWTPADPTPALRLARGEEHVGLLPPCRPPGIAVTSGLHLSRPRPQPYRLKAGPAGGQPHSYQLVDCSYIATGPLARDDGFSTASSG
jgi:hypothetical protein